MLTWLKEWNYLVKFDGTILIRHTNNMLKILYFLQVI